MLLFDVWPAAGGMGLVPIAGAPALAVLLVMGAGVGALLLGFAMRPMCCNLPLLLAGSNGLWSASTLPGEAVQLTVQLPGQPGVGVGILHAAVPRGTATRSVLACNGQRPRMHCSTEPLASLCPAITTSRPL